MINIDFNRYKGTLLVTDITIALKKRRVNLALLLDTMVGTWSVDNKQERKTTSYNKANRRSGQYKLVIIEKWEKIYVFLSHLIEVLAPPKIKVVQQFQS